MTKEDKRIGIKHECELEAEENEFAMARMCSCGWCIQLRRFLWSSILIWRNDSRSMSTYKSEYMIRRENVRKLQMKNKVIHPFSMLRNFWELWMGIIFGITFALPLNRYFSVDLQYLRYILSTFNVLDIIMTFNSGYQCSDTRQIVCHRGYIAARYLKTWFIVDLLSTPSYCLFKPRILTFPYVKYGQFLILLRLHTLMAYAFDIKTSHQSHGFKSNIIRFLIPIIILFLWISHMYYIMDNPNHIDSIKYYETHKMMRIFSNIYQMGYAYHLGTKPCLLDSAVIVIGFILELVFLTFIFRMVRVASHLMYKYIDILNQMDRYAAIKRIPASIRKRMHVYMQYKIAHAKFQEPALLNELPKSLQRELLTSLYSHLLQKSPIFHDLPMEIILDLTSRLTSKLYMPSDVIVQAGSEADIMFFIRSGIVAVYTQSGKEICHLNDGNSFGELIVMENEVRNATAVAIHWCDMCLLSRVDLLRVFKNHPELFAKLQQDVHKRSTNMGPTDGWSTQSNESGSLSLNSSSTTVVHI